MSNKQNFLLQKENEATSEVFDAENDIVLIHSHLQNSKFWRSHN